MSSKSPLLKSLRRIQPEKRLQRLGHRSRALLPFLSVLHLPLPKLLLDTTVYIDGLQGQLPEEVEGALSTGDLWHCPVTESELAVSAGRLDPSHPQRKTILSEIAESIELRPEHRILTPDREVWREAGVLAGLLARLQGYGKSEQRQTLNDALLLLTAAKHGCAVLTRNILDFDLLLQLDERGTALFYDRL